MDSAGPSADSPRRILYANHERWSVYESAGVYDRRSPPDLIFESDSTIRRVRTYPPNWRELSDAELWAVSWHR